MIYTKPLALMKKTLSVQDYHKSEEIKHEVDVEGEE